MRTAYFKLQDAGHAQFTVYGCQSTVKKYSLQPAVCSCQYTVKYDVRLKNKLLQTVNWELLTD